MKAKAMYASSMAEIFFVPPLPKQNDEGGIVSVAVPFNSTAKGGSGI
ncbi:uncharacterized protein G2W53_007337 [Senna tora]|uniref:Uncharacterized protein n=1 Tax=Senna tora TaxID=362788 RepID=A0A834X6I5_9FABA|nr:uncharacterized protein G2W53_007337 [Senna tora]